MRFPWPRRLSWKAFFKEIYREYEHDSVADSAAVLSYYFVYSLFPFLFFLTTLAAYIPHLQGALETTLERVHVLLPPQALHIIDKNLRALVERQRPHFLTIGLAVTLYSASRGVDAVRKALNLAYDVKESRPFWKTELVAFGMTIAGAALVLIGIAALVAGGDLGMWLAGKLHIARAYVVAWSWLRWPVTAFVIMSSVAFAYYFLPDVKQEFRFITPGSVVGTVVWLLATWGFAEYAGHFGSYNVTFGSIGGVIVLMTWFYISGFIFLVGGEVNAILERKSAGGKAAGARAPGEAPPPPSQRPSAMPPGAAAKASTAEETPGGANPPPGGAAPPAPGTEPAENRTH
jgi:membrane protein